MNSTSLANREHWLTSAIDQMRPVFDLINQPLPRNIRVSCSLPSGGVRSNAIGECWSDKASADGTHEIFINPKLDKPLDVFAVLVHELVHTLPKCFDHGQKFGRVCDALGLAPGAKGYKSTVPGAEFAETYANLLAGLGDYPHAALSPMLGKKKQGIRMLKASCPSCGYTIRLSAKWADKGLPECICGDHLSL